MLITLAQIEHKENKLHEAAFRRYCAEHDMTFIGAGNQPPPNETPKRPNPQTERGEVREEQPLQTPQAAIDEALKP
jgi:hypothetical protein